MGTEPSGSGSSRASRSPGTRARRRAPRTAARAAEAGLALAATLGAGALLARLLAFEYGLDQGIYAVVSDSLLRGGAPYRDAWDFKPPGIFAVYALARGLFGPGMHAVRIVEALGFASLFPAFVLYARRFTGSAIAGVLGAALAVAGHVWLGFWHTAQPESFGAVLIVWALVATTTRVEGAAGAEPRARRRQMSVWAAAGALYGMAALLKPPLGGGILVSAAFAAAAEGRGVSGAGRARLRAMARPLVAHALGGLAPLAATLAFFAAHGALDDLARALFVFAPEYTRINYARGTLSGFLYRAAATLFLRFSALAWAGVALLVLLPRLGGRERSGAAHVAGVLAMVVLGVALQGRFFAYHFGAAVPLLALLGGWGLAKLIRVAPRGVPLGVVLVVLLVWGLAHRSGLDGPVPGGFFERARRVDDGRAWNVPNRRVAERVTALTDPGDRIYVWGFRPVIYDLAGRRPASRYVYNAPQRTTWAAARSRRVLVRELRAARPAAILVEHGDEHPGTTGSWRDSATALERFPALRRLLETRYREAETVGDFTIHLRREASPPPAG